MEEMGAGEVMLVRKIQCQEREPPEVTHRELSVPRKGWKNLVPGCPQLICSIAHFSERSGECYREVEVTSQINHLNIRKPICSKIIYFPFIKGNY